MSEKIHNVLFLCTGNSARSIMAEVLLTTMGQGRFRGYSAGSHPTGRIHPLTLEKLREIGYPLESLRSKSWDEFTAADAPPMDFIITVCDNAAGEICPVWPGQPVSAHWSFADPAAAAGTDQEKRAAFDRIFRQIMARVTSLASLSLHTLDRNAIRHALQKIGANQ